MTVTFAGILLIAISYYRNCVVLERILLLQHLNTRAVKFNLKLSHGRYINTRQC
jgi:hypothetical protein